MTRGGSGTRAVMKSLNHHLILSLLNEDDDDDDVEILKNVDKPLGNTSTPAEQPGASNSRTAHISEATVPSSSVDGHSSKSLHYSVDGGSSKILGRHVEVWCLRT